MRPIAREANRAKRGRGAEWDDKRFLALGVQLVGNTRHFQRAIRARGDEADLGTEELIELEIAGRFNRRFGAVEVEDQDRAQAQCRRRSRGCPRMIRLHAAARNHDVGASARRLAHHRLQLPHLVAAAAERQQVVALHQQRWTRRSERGSQPRQSIDGRRVLRELYHRRRHQGRKCGRHSSVHRMTSASPAASSR